MKRSLILFIIMLFISQGVNGLPNTSPVKNWYNVNYITSMVRTGSKLAVGSTKGVILFTPADSAFVILDKVDGLLDNQVNAIASDGENIYICFPSGLTVLAADTSQVRNISTSFTGLQGEPQAIFLKGDTVFLGTTRFFYVWDTEGDPYDPFSLAWTYSAYSARHSGVNAFRVISDTLYIGTDNGLCMVPDNQFSDTTQWVWNTSADGLPNDTVTAFEQLQTVLWTGTRGGVARGSMGNWSIQNTGLSSLLVNDLLANNDNQLFAATEDAPHVWDDGMLEWQRLSNGLGSNKKARAMATMESAGEDVLWIGLDGDGIAQYDTAWQRQCIPGPSSNNFSDIAIDGNGGIWGVHYGGFVPEPRWYTISHCDGEAWEILNEQNVLGVEGAFRWVDIDAEGQKWFGIWHLGAVTDIIVLSDDTLWDSLGLPLSGVVGSQFIDSKGNKWFSTFGNAVCKLHPDHVTWETFTDENYFNYIVAFAEDSKGNMYFGSVQRGVSVMTPEGTLLRINGLPSEQVYDIAVDMRDEVWIGTTGSGVVVVRDFEVVQHYSSTNSGLLGDIINDIAIDWQGNRYFLVGNRGVSMLYYTGVWDSLTTSQGLASDLILDDIDGLAFDTPHGYLWVATRDGISRYDTGLHPPDQDSTLKAVDVFPNPFVTRRHSRVTFDQMPGGAEIYIYSISMERVRVITDIEDETHRAFWYGKNDRDEPVDSGVYLFVICHPNGSKRTGKIAVVR